MYQMSLLQKQFTDHSTDKSIFLPKYFQLTECNDTFFHQVIDSNEPKVKMVLGPQYSGKTHIANVWRNKHNASYLQINKEQNFREIVTMNQCFIIDNMEQWIKKDEKILFDLLNMIVFEYKKSLLLTTTHYPNQLDIKTRDLLSRLLTIPIYEIPLPDEELIRKILQKRFNDMQLHINHHTICFIANRIPRTFKAMDNIVQKITEFSLEYNVSITSTVVKNIMEKNTL